MLSALRALFASLTSRAPRPRKAAGEGAAGPSYFQTYNYARDHLHASVTTVGPKFVISAICRKNHNHGRPFILNAADENLATALAWIMSDYAEHEKREHRK